MSTRSNARYTAWPTDVLVYPKNSDGTLPTPTNIIGGVGPFDFSGVTTDTAVPLIVKIDSEDAETTTIDVTTAALESAVTVTELVTAINLAAPTDMTASEDDNGRLKFAYSGSGDPTRVQVYGDVATIGGVGYSKGMRISYLNTQQSLTFSPTRKDSETITATDAEGKDIEITTAGTRKGSSGTIVDTASDWYLKTIIDGGEITSAGGYNDPNPDSEDVYFVIEYVYGVYGEGTNLEGDIVGYEHSSIRNCIGYLGDETKDRNIGIYTYNWTATAYKEDGVYMSDRTTEKLTTEEYELADYEGLASY